MLLLIILINYGLIQDNYQEQLVIQIILKQLKFINHSYDIKQHPHTIYLSESGMYKLILRSKMPNTNEVLPSIRKYGYYKIKKTYENQKSNLLEKINDLEKRSKIMANDMKKEKFPNGALVYIIDYSDEDTTIDGIFKLGKTNNLKKRKSIYDTHMLHKKQVISKEFTEKPLQLENCIKSIKNMTQTGGSNTLQSSTEIDLIKNKIIKLLN